MAGGRIRYAIINISLDEGGEIWTIRCLVPGCEDNKDIPSDKMTKETNPMTANCCIGHAIMMAEQHMTDHVEILNLEWILNEEA